MIQRAYVYWRIFVTSFKEDGANPQRLISSIVQLLLRIALVVFIFQAAYAVNAAPGISLHNALWSVSFFLAFSLGLGVRNMARVIDIDIKIGGLEMQLIKPLDWRLVKTMQLLGKSIPEYVTQLIVLPILLLIFVGPPDISYLNPLTFALIVLLVLLTIVAMINAFTIIGMSGFWTNDAMSAFRLIDKIAALCAGAFVPVALLPELMQQIVRWTPFGIYSSPQLFFNPHAPEILGQLYVSGILWTVILIATSKVVWYRASRRMEVNGG